MILNRIPENERPAMHLKVLAAETLNGRRSQWGYSRSWKGNYLTQVRIGSQWNHRGVTGMGSLTVMNGKLPYTGKIR